MAKIDLTRRSFIGLSGAALGLTACASQQGGPAPDDVRTGDGGEPSDDAAPVADLLFTNAVVQTMRAEDDVAEAVAISGSEILFVGSAADAEQYVDNRTHRVDLGGCFVAPGLMDGHLHVLEGAVEGALTCDLTNYSTNEEYLKALRSFVEASPDREAYFGSNYVLTMYQLDDGSNPGPNKADLDAICPDKPLLVYDVARESVWANSKALELGGITKDTQDPEGGTIYRDEEGNPRGCLAGTAMALIPLEQSYTESEYLGALKAFCDLCNSYGLTGATNIDVFGAEGVRLLHKLEEAGALTLRMNLATTCSTQDDPREVLEIIDGSKRYASDMLTCKTVKVFADGTVERGTAWMLEPYDTGAGFGEDWRGEQLWSDDDLNAAVALFDGAGVQVHAHAMGDAAVHQVIDAFEAVGNPSLRHTIAHACAISDEDVQRMAGNDILATLQFAWMYDNALCEIETRYLGEERAQAFYPTRALQDAGVRISGGSDGPSSVYRALDEMETGVTRNSPYTNEEDDDFYRWPEQGLSAYELLQAHTTNVAYQNFCEDKVGTIEVGKKADLVCLDTNILTCDPKKIGEARVLFTVVDGKIVYEG